MQLTSAKSLCLTLALTALFAGAVATTAAAQPSVSSIDALYMHDAALINVAEVVLAQTAYQHAAATATRQYAQHMIVSHIPATIQLIGLANMKGIALPPLALFGPPNPQASSAGTQFDIFYLRGQVRAHARAIEVFQFEAANGSDAEIKAYAASKIPDLQEHLTMAQAALQSLGASLTREP